ncbi:hypothetical protein OG725_37160 (plasmid) [Streptomyces sp. NBC_01213]|uniref:hypothetical protein n=1 Tax=Streptomyces sp. NBC_01213 TaxID=2903776 RepID=UPI002F90FDEC|nr:hypothetical protein OG725_37160 [Streptomyces sp. NBC_01213]
MTKLAGLTGEFAQQLTSAEGSNDTLAMRLRAGHVVPSQEIREVFQELRAYSRSIAQDELLGIAIWEDEMWSDILKQQVRS